MLKLNIQADLLNIGTQNIDTSDLVASLVKVRCLGAFCFVCFVFQQKTDPKRNIMQTV